MLTTRAGPATFTAALPAHPECQRFGVLLAVPRQRTWRRRTPVAYIPGPGVVLGPRQRSQTI
jgi:hypothetical protein